MMALLLRIRIPAPPRRAVIGKSPNLVARFIQIAG
jgi:hypothetical protein